MKRMQSSRWLSRSVEDSSRAWTCFILNDPSGEVMPALVRSWSFRSDANPMQTPASTRTLACHQGFLWGRRPMALKRLFPPV
uniref:Uncharacterized protein n=1 Tax=Salmo trutta TaxID=8032 RepID=A0A674B019_SALTR